MARHPASVDEIFFEALRLASVAQRAAFLSDACEGDSDLRARVERLLQAYPEAGSFLESPGAPVTATIDQPLLELPGTQIGPYKLLEQIGEGGMGIVYVASQREPIRRNVALKIIKPGMDTREVVARFEAERQALAMMDHPNIAKILDGGTIQAGGFRPQAPGDRPQAPGDRLEAVERTAQQSSFPSDLESEAWSLEPPACGLRPYFVMELVKGTPITVYCDRQQLSTRERLELFVPVCHGVQHAHQKGIIHRDLKPSNLLVEVHDAEPVPKIIDFGIAKAMGQRLTDQSLHTGVGQMVGTPLYMSPEQAGRSAVDVDTRSDIYSLGVVLYELLTGHTPFERDALRTAGVDEIRRIIREVEPPRPSARVSTLEAADLSTICDRRHIEPRKLSQQLRGDLDWIVMKAMDKDRDRRYATANDLAADVRRYLNHEPVQARPPSLVHHAAKWVRRHRPLVWPSAAVLAVTVVAGGVLFGTNYRRTTLLERDAGEHLAAATAFLGSGNYTAADRELADARGHLEAAGNDAGPLAENVTSLTAAIAAKTQALGDFEKFQNLRHRIHSEMYALDRTILDQAQEHARAALDLFGVFATEPWRVQADFENLDPVRQAMLDEGAVELLFVWARLEMGLSDTQPTAERIACYRRAIEALGKIESFHPPIPAVDLWMADCCDAIGDTQAAAAARARAESLQPTSATDYYLLGEYHAQHGQQDEALASYWQALARQPDHYLSLLAAGVALGELQEYKSAEAMLTGAIAMNPQTVIAFVQRATARAAQNKIVLAQADIQEAQKLDPELARALVQRAGEYRASFQLGKALTDYNEAIRLDPQAAAYQGRGMTYTIQRDVDKALADCDEAIRLEPGSAAAYRARAEVCRMYGNPERALADTNEGIRLDSKYALNYLTRGMVYAIRGEWDKALADADEAVRLAPQDSSVWAGISEIHAQHGDLEKALADCQESIRLDPNNNWGYFTLAYYYRDNGDLDKSLATFTEAIRVAPEYGPAYSARAAIHRAKGDFDQALADCNEAIRVAPQNAWAYTARAGFHKDRRDFGKALADYSEVIRLAPQNPWAFTDRAAFHQDRGDFDKALADYDDAVRVAPENAWAYTARAAFHNSRGDFDQALADYSEAIRIAPQYAWAFNDAWWFAPSKSEAYTARAAFYSGRGDFEKALSDYNEAIRLAPQNVRAYTSRADFHRGRGDVDESLADWTEAIRIAPRVGWLYHYRADCHIVRGDLDKALADENEAIRIEPRSTSSCIGRAAIYRAKGDFDKALANYDEAIRVAPQDAYAYGAGYWSTPHVAEAYIARAAFHNDRGDVEKALVDYNEAVRLDPHNVTAYTARANFHKGRGDFDKSLADWTEAIRLAPSSAASYMSRADIHTAKGDSDKALADYSEAVRVAPQNATTYIARAAFHKDRGDFDKALVDLDEAIRLDPKSAWAFNCRGNVYDSQGEQDKAVADFSEAIRLDPKGAWAYAVWGRLYAAKGDFDKGLADCNEAIQLNPKLVHAYLCRANAYKAQGDLDKALDDLNQAVQIDPQYSWAYGDRARIYEDRGDLERALADYSESIRLNPAPPCGARASRANLYVQMREFDKAVADYDQMGEMGRGDWWHYKRKAEAHFQLQHYDKALESIAKAVELNPGDGSNLWWIPPAEVAKCPDERLRQGVLALADKAIETTQGGAQTHMARAMLYDAFGRDDEARVDFDKALQLDPTQPLFWAWRASFHAEHARWNETVADLSKLLELHPEQTDVWYHRSLARLGGGQTGEYRQDCGEMLKRFGQTDKASDRYWVAWACVLAPDATTDWATAVALAEQSVQNDPQSAMYLNTLGAVLYRAGRFDEALVRLSEAAALVEQTGTASKLLPAYPWFFLAMTHHRLGHAEEAKPWLDKAVTWTDKTLAEADQGTADLPWNRRLTLKTFRDEATALLGVKPPTAEPAAKVEEAKELPKSTPALEAAKEEETSNK